MKHYVIFQLVWALLTVFVSMLTLMTTRYPRVVAWSMREDILKILTNIVMIGWAIAVLVRA